MGRYDGGSAFFTAAEFKNRGVIKSAPDALIHISTGFKTSVIAPMSGKEQSIDFQEGITSISIQNNVDPPGSSTASIEISTPIYNMDQSSYWVTFEGEDGKLHRVPYFVPMMEVQIFFKGRFLVGTNTRYYPSFWGFITNVEESYSGNMYKIHLSCADMLHWWSFSTVAFRPSVESNSFVNNKQGLTVFGSRYEQSNVFEIMYGLTQTMGFENFQTPAWIGKQTSSPRTLNKDDRWVNQVYPNIMQYWNARFSQATNLLKMYGTQGQLIVVPKNPKPKIRPPANTPNAKGTSKSKHATENKITEPFDVIDLDKQLGNFQVLNTFDAMKSLSQAEYMSKLEIAIDLKNRVEYEFFQDVNGNFIFKPPFYNLDVRPALPYRISPVDIITYSTAMNSDEVVTALEVQTSILQQVRQEPWVNYTGYHIDMDLVKRYGWRYKHVPVWWLSETNLAYSYAVGHMGLINAKTLTGSVTIPGRPELRLGYPVFIEHLDAFYYVKSINHSFDYGGSFTTTLSLEAKREKVYDIDKNGHLTVQKDMVFNRIPTKAPPVLMEQKYLKPDPNDPQKVVFPPDKSQEDPEDPETKLQNLYRGAGFIKSVEPGFYNIEKAENVKGLAAKDKGRITGTTVPYTDEFGYRVVGNFRYGRGIALNPGVVIDGAEIQTTANLTSQDITINYQNIVITGMKSASEQEGNYMRDYFKNAGGSIETEIPQYFNFNSPNAVPDNESIAKIQTGMRPENQK